MATASDFWDIVFDDPAWTESKWQPLASPTVDGGTE